jgi:hypothetical protein
MAIPLSMLIAGCLHASTGNAGIRIRRFWQARDPINRENS